MNGYIFTVQLLQFSFDAVRDQLWRKPILKYK